VIKWCAYCQRFITEIEPFEDYRISHSICRACYPKLAALGEADIDALAGVIGFYKRLGELALSGEPADIDSILAESRQLGIRPVDLMVGILQPLLARVGDLWSAGELSVAGEHCATTMVHELLIGLREPRKPRVREPRPRVVLVNAEGNYHTLGLMMAEVYFASHDVTALTVAPGLPTEEVLALIARTKPEVFGFSVALSTQMAQVREVATLLRTRPERPKHFVVGGPAMRIGLNPDLAFGIRVCKNLAEVLGLLSGEPLLDPSEIGPGA
jgi:methanogenic corrinoid protein MtbC1